ncbi:MAG: hypothetical protein V3V97_01735 [Hyphomicrobiaceae bacterium]
MAKANTGIWSPQSRKQARRAHDRVTPFLSHLSSVWAKPLTANYRAGLLSSVGGLVVLREAALRRAATTDMGRVNQLAT